LGITNTEIINALYDNKDSLENATEAYNRGAGTIATASG
jgi:hypothetical protein